MIVVTQQHTPDIHRSTFVSLEGLTLQYNEHLTLLYKPDIHSSSFVRTITLSCHMSFHELVGLLKG
jgi:hypothetical protein